MENQSIHSRRLITHEIHAAAGPLVIQTGCVAGAGYLAQLGSRARKPSLFRIAVKFVEWLDNFKGELTHDFFMAIFKTT